MHQPVSTPSKFNFRIHLIIRHKPRHHHDLLRADSLNPEPWTKDGTNLFTVRLLGDKSPSFDTSSSKSRRSVPTTHTPQSSSFLGLPYRILNMNPKKELLWGLWVIDLSGTT